MRKVFLVSSVAFACAAAWPAGADTAPVTGEWNFTALLDGSPIGRHRFSVAARGDRREVVSEAEFAVKMLGITAYRYRHKASEVWQGDCLASLAANTDDDGKVATVRGERQGDDFVVTTGAASQTVAPCAMTFAYWNPALRDQTRLIDPQTGKVETVQVRRTGSGPIEVGGKTITATSYRITGPKQPIDVWYGADGQWVGLDSTVAGGRKLSYRLP